jgi:hypothetical protein
MPRRVDPVSFSPDSTTAISIGSMIMTDDTASTNGASSATGVDTDAQSRYAQVMLIRSVSLSGILFLMVLYTMYFAASLLLPITLAFLLSLVLSPVCRFMVSMRIPRTLSALLIMLSVAATLTAGVYA